MDKQLDQLEAVLKELTASHESLLSLLRRKRQALREADRDRVTSCCERENEFVQQISELEKHRLELIGELTEAIEPGADQPLRLATLAGRVAEPRRGRILVLRQQLRERMERVRDEVAVIRKATESLTRHMQGLVQTVAGAMAGVYGQGGGPTPVAMTVSTFDATG